MRKSGLIWLRTKFWDENSDESSYVILKATLEQGGTSGGIIPLRSWLRHFRQFS